MQLTQLLSWDSEIFGFPVGKILSPHLTASELRSALGELRAQGVKLAYWVAAKTSEQGLLVDRKVTYVLDLTKIHLPSTSEAVDYDAALPSPALEALALESGSYSRFKVDPRVGIATFEKIYKAWIANSTQKVIADRVLVIPLQETIAAMSTLSEKAGRGDIGLLAVAVPFRGQGLGQKIVHASLTAFQQRGLQTVQVVTQLANVPACRLYERCGFVQEKEEYFYHFWL